MSDDLLEQSEFTKAGNNRALIFTPLWFLLAIIGAIPVVLNLFLSHLLVFTLIFDGLLLIFTMVDFFILPSKPFLEVKRDMPPTLSLDQPAKINITIRNFSGLTQNLLLKDTSPPELEGQSGDIHLRVVSGMRVEVEYSLVPKKRGDFRFGSLWIRVRSPLGLLYNQQEVPLAQMVKVYPTLAESGLFELAARKGRLQELGIRAARRMGAGREFESLREYQPDDEYRRIDWKATARHGKLISRQYETDKSQNLILVIDAGRTMVAEHNGKAKLDYAINAALMLSYVAVQSDDRVGLLAFADTVRLWIPPGKGRKQVYRMMDSLHSLHASRAEPDYRGAFTYLASRWRRRSLIVCFTDLWDPDSSRQTINELIALQPRHLVACVTLLDSRALQLADEPVSGKKEAYEKAVALQVLDDRKLASMELEQRGIITVDSSAENLSAALVNRYLEVKERMLL
jgi:uncharacterized protein (DUF58 family)